MTSKAPKKRPIISRKASLIILAFAAGYAVVRTVAISQEQTEKHTSALPVAIAHTKGGELELQIASTATEREKGLQGVPKLLPGHGVLFLTEQPQIPKMWMRHVAIPLDMVFVRDGVISDVFTNVPPCADSTLICPTYSPRQKVDAVIEVGAGEAMRLGFAKGGRVNIPQPSVAPSLGETIQRPTLLQTILDRSNCITDPGICHDSV